MGALRANRNFRLLWIGQVLSDLGTQIGNLAYPLLVLALTHSALIAGTVGTAASGAAFAVRLPAGALADRLDRRRTMVLCDGTRMLALIALAALVVTHAVSWPIVLVVAASAHRQAALDATAFLIDWLKTKAPFWKREDVAGGAGTWVDAREEDDVAAARWSTE